MRVRVTSLTEGKKNPRYRGDEARSGDGKLRLGGNSPKPTNPLNQEPGSPRNARRVPRVSLLKTRADARESSRFRERLLRIPKVIARASCLREIPARRARGIIQSKSVDFAGNTEGDSCVRRRERPGRLPGLRLSAGAARRHPARLGLSPRPAGFRCRRQLLPEPGDRNRRRRALRPADHAAARSLLPAGLRLRLSCIALLYLALVSPPLSDWWRVAGFLVLGAGAGLLNLALFHAISPGYEADAAGTVNTGGNSCTAWAAWRPRCWSPAPSTPTRVPSILIFMALVPGFFAGIYARKSYAAPPQGTHPTLRQALQDFRSPGAVLFALLLFFPVRQRMVDRRLAAHLSHPARRPEPIEFPDDPGPILAVPDHRAPGCRGHPAARAPRTPADGQHGVSAIFGCLFLFFTETRFGACDRRLFSSAPGSPASIRWWRRPSGGAFPITIPGSSTVSSRLRWSAACWRPPRWGMRHRNGAWAW